MSQTKRLSYVLILNVLMIAGLLITGIKAHSLGVLAAGGDFVADSLAIMLGLLAVHMRDARGKRQAPTYVALVNGLLLLFVTAIVLFQAVHRLTVHNPAVHGLPVLIISAVSALVMAAGAVILGKSAGSEDLHMRSVLLDTLSDSLAAAAVAVVGGIIFFTHGNYWLDSVVAIVVSAVILYGAVKLLCDVVMTVSLDNRTHMAIKHTYHCLIGCGIGEILGMLIASAFGWHRLGRLALAIILAFLFGYALTYRSVRKDTKTPREAIRITMGTDTISIASMELVDNTIEFLIPNALLVSATSFRFWWGLALSLIIAFIVTVPVNRYMMGRGAHAHHHH